MKKIMCLILVMLLFSNMPVCAAKYSDVKAGSSYYEAVEELSELGIIKGYTNGTFRPENVITRAEAAAIIIRLMGLEAVSNNTANNSASVFNDVNKTDWFFSYVALASQMGIISGDGDGTFRPNDVVKQEEMIKLLVAACGANAEMAMVKGGWPDGYITLAHELGIYNKADVKIGKDANRGIVANMTKGALYAPRYVQELKDGKLMLPFYPNPDMAFIKVVFSEKSNQEENTEKEVVEEEKVDIKHPNTFYVENRVASWVSSHAECRSFIITDVEYGYENTITKEEGKKVTYEIKGIYRGKYDENFKFVIEFYDKEGYSLGKEEVWLEVPKGQEFKKKEILYVPVETTEFKFKGVR